LLAGALPFPTPHTIEACGGFAIQTIPRQTPHTHQIHNLHPGKSRVEHTSCPTSDANEISLKHRNTFEIGMLLDKAEVLALRAASHDAGVVGDARHEHQGEDLGRLNDDECLEEGQTPGE